MNRLIATSVLMALATLSGFATADISTTTVFRSTSLSESTVLAPTITINPALYAAAPNSASNGRFMQLGGSTGINASNAQCINGGTFPVSVPLDSGGAGLGLPTTTNLQSVSEIQMGEGLFIEVTDLDQNLMASDIEFLDVVIQTEDGLESINLRLTETDVDSGQFIGGIQPTTGTPDNSDCILTLNTNQIVQIQYTDPNDTSDQLILSALVEPSAADIFLSRQASHKEARYGDIIELSFLAENRVDAGPALTTFLTDQLPTGLSPIDGSVTVDGESTNAVFSSSNIQIEIPAPWTPGQQREIQYRARVSAATELGSYTMSASISDLTSQFSNQAQLPIRFKSRFHDAGTIIGEVMVESDDELIPAAGVTLILDDGTYVTTDAHGRFRFDGLANGGHAIIIDPRRLPKEYLLPNNGYRFLKIHNGQLQRTRFMLQPNPEAEQHTDSSPTSQPLTLLKPDTQAISDNQLLQRYRIQIGADALDDVEILFTAPQQMRYVTNSVHINDYPVVEPVELSDNTYAFYLGRSPANSELILEFKLEPITGKPTAPLIEQLSDAISLRYSSVVDPVNYLVDREGSEFVRLVNGSPVWQERTDQQEAALGLLDLKDGDRLHDPAQSIRVRIPELLTPHLYIDGQEVSADQIGFRMSDPVHRYQQFTYVGVPLGEPGNHEIKITGVGPFGITRYEQAMAYTRVGSASTIIIESLPDQIADGETPILLKVQFKDELGQELKGDIHLKLQSKNLRGLDDTQPADRVIRNWDGYLRLAPQFESGLYQGTLTYQGQQQTFELYLKPAQTDWVLVGFAEGTVGYQTLRNHMQPEQQQWYTDGESRLYAQGVVDGEWLTTLRVDSSKPFYGDESDALKNQTFTLFADQSQSRNDTGTSGMLYVRMERERAKWLFSSQLQQAQGVKLVEFSQFMTGLTWQRIGDQSLRLTVGQSVGQRTSDTLEITGLSSGYLLSQTPIKPFSEKVIIEVRDRVSGDLLSRRQLSNVSDYQLNYSTGELTLRTALMATDLDLNPQQLVVSYDTDQQANPQAVAILDTKHTLDEKTQLNTSLVVREHDEEQVIGGIGLTRQWSQGEWSIATAMDEDQNTATSISIDREQDSLNWQAQWQQKDAGYGLQSEPTEQSSVVNLDTNIQLNKQQSIELNSRLSLLQDEQTSRLLFKQRWSKTTLAAGLAAERQQNGQAQFGVAQWQQRLNDRGSHLQTALEYRLDDEPSSDFYNIFRTGLSHPIRNGLSLEFNNEWTDNGTESTIASRLGLTAEPWQGAEFVNEVSNETDGDQALVRNRLGAKQTFQISEQLHVDFGFDRFTVVQGDPDQAYLAAYVRGEYQQESTLYQTQLEFRDDNTGEQWQFGGEVFHVLNDWAVWSANLDTQWQEQGVDLSLTAQLARHAPSRNLVDRYRITFDQQSELSQGVTVEGQWAFMAGPGQWSVQNGFAWVHDLDQQNSSWLEFLGLQYQQTINSDWDWGLQTAMLVDNEQSHQGSFGPYLGRTLSDSLWLGLGYNLQGFTVEQMTVDRATRQGLYMTIRVLLQPKTTQQFFDRQRQILAKN